VPESTDLELRRMSDSAAMTDDELSRTIRIAQDLAKSAMFKAEPGKSVTPHQAFAKILIGRDLGISPTQALMGIDIVKGNIQLRGVLLASFVRKSPDYDYRVLEHDETHCKIEFTRCPAYRPLTAADQWEVVGVSEFSMEDAQKAGLVKDGSAWKAHPRNMVLWRAMSNGVKWYCPDLLGGIPVYTEADSFEGTATEISTGSGDGSEPGWGDMSEENVAAVEAIIGRAQALGHAGLSDRATAQMTLSGQPDSVVLMWCERTGRELDEFEASRAEQGTADQGDEHAMPPDALREQLGQVLDRIAAEEEAGADDAIMAPLYAEQERLEGLLGDEPGDEGQETMPL
jgi:hypothetical protein